MSDVAAPATPALPAGKQRNLGLMVLWMLLTFNIYWLFWLYKTYKEVRAHSPSATTVTPGQGVGFLLIPLFNIFWFFRVMVDFPRAIRRMQADHPLGEAPLANGGVTFLLILGFLFNMASSVHPAFLLLGEASLLSGFLMAQSALNQHWRRHLTGPLPATAAPATSLGDFLGARGASLAVGPAVAFLVAWFLSDLPGGLVPLFQGGSLPPAVVWGRMLIDAVLLTVLVVFGLRLVASDFAAALLASLAYALLSTALLILVFHIGSSDLRNSIGLAASSLLWPLLLLFGLAVTLRIIRPTWLAIWIAALAGFLLSAVAVNAIYGLVLGSSSYFPELREVLTELAAATVFAFAFWGGTRLVQGSAPSA